MVKRAIPSLPPIIAPIIRLHELVRVRAHVLKGEPSEGSAGDVEGLIAGTGGDDDVFVRGDQRREDQEERGDEGREAHDGSVLTWCLLDRAVIDFGWLEIRFADSLRTKAGDGNPSYS